MPPAPAELRDAVRRRLELAESTGNPAVPLEPGALMEAQALAAALGDDASDLESRYLLGWLYYYRFRARVQHALDEGRDLAAGFDPAMAADYDAAIAQFVPCLLTGTTERLPDELVPDIAGDVIAQVDALLERARTSFDRALADDAIGAIERIIPLITTDDPDWPDLATNLGDALELRFHLAGNRADIEAAVAAMRRAAEGTPEDSPAWPRVLSSLSQVLQTRFTVSGERADIDAAVAAAEESVRVAPPGYVPRPALVYRLAAARVARGQATGNLADLEAGVSGLGKAADASAGLPQQPLFASAATAASAALPRVPGGDRAATRDAAELDAAIEASRRDLRSLPDGDPQRALLLVNLAEVLWRRARQIPGLTDLNEAVDVLEEAVKRLPAGAPLRAVGLNLLGLALLHRAERGGDAADFDAAVAAARQAVLAAPEGATDRVAFEGNLAAALRVRSLRTTHAGGADDLAEAVRLEREVLAATPGTHPMRAMRQSALGGAVRDRLAQSLTGAGLDEAVAVGREAVTAAAAGSPELADLRYELGGTLLARFRHDGQAADLDEAVEVLREAVGAEPLAAHLAMLGRALRIRFRQTGSAADLDAAIAAGRRAVDSAGAGELDRAAMVSDLGLALQNRYARAGRQADLDAAVGAFAEASALAAPGNPDRVGYQSNLAAALLTRYGSTRAATDLRDAVRAGRGALAGAPAGHPLRTGILTNYGLALLSSGERLWHRHDLDAAIDAFDEVLATLPGDHPDRAAVLFNTGLAWEAYFARTRRAKHAGRAARAYAAATAVELAAPSLRIRAARAAAALLAGPDPGQAARLLELAVELLGEVTPRELTRTDQQYALGGFAGLAADAAALALAVPGQDGTASATRALRLLESGRTVIIGQLLSARDDLAGLRDASPELARRFTGLRDLLDRPSSPAGPADPDDVPGGAAEERRMLRAELNRTLAEIRALDGLADFGLPPGAAELTAAGAAGPVAVLNVSSYGSHALLLTEGRIGAIPLGALTPEVVAERARALHQALDDIGRGERGAEGTVTAVLGWLWDAVARPVLDALGVRGRPADDAVWPRLWWVPGGVLGLLPVHAAGYHAEPGRLPEGSPAAAPRAVLDRVISSYAPSVRALCHARRADEPQAEPARSLVVAMPVTPGLPPGAELPYAGQEARTVAGLFPDRLVLAEDDLDGLSAGVPTRAAVLAALRDCTVAHFACHGVSDPGDPSASGLLLHDHADAPLTVAELAPYRHEHLQVCYLSACRTSVTERAELADEAIHLASAFLILGARHVIGTLWEIRDRFAWQVAGSFYARLCAARPDGGAGWLTAGRSALALHQAVRELREGHRTAPSAWAAYLHVGA